jgi:hypothetical protein
MATGKKIQPQLSGPTAFQEWSTKSVRETFFASLRFPRLLNADVIKETIVRGVANGLLAYVAKVRMAV